jgi:hypothetical protein
MVYQHQLVRSEDLQLNLASPAPVQRKLPVGPTVEQRFQLAGDPIDQELQRGGH